MNEVVTKAVFLSYASQDAETVKHIAQAMRAAGAEVWFDKNELVGGDAWDAKIRRQIAECALFVPVISANTQARLEGFFRIEWKLAAQRTHAMAEEKAFLLPVVIDATPEDEAKVPAEFRAVQWTRLADEAAAQDRFCERVKKLLGGEAAKASPPRGTSVGAPQQKSSRPWLIPVILGVAVVAVLTIWQPWRRRETIASAPTVAAPVASALSETQQLIAQISVIVEKQEDGTRDEWTLAETMGAQAVKLEPRNVDAWAAYSQATLGLYEFYFDRARSPLADAIKRAQQAVSLAADSDEARFALADCFRLRRETWVEAEQMLRDLAGRRPEDRRVWRALAAVVRDRQLAAETAASKSVGAAPTFVEALAFFDRAVALPGGDPVALRRKAGLLELIGRQAEADVALDRSITLRPGPAAQVQKIISLLCVHDDLAQASALVEKLPGSYFLREDVSEWAARVWLWRRNADRCLRVVRAWPEDFLFETPKGFMAGQALLLGGKTDAARLEWQGALRVVEQHLAATGGVRTQPIFLHWKSRLLACLGETAEAELALRTYEQGPRQNTAQFRIAATLVALGKTEAALDVLETAAQISPVRVTVMGRNTILLERAALRHDPTWDPLRGQARFVELLKTINSDAGR